MEGGYGLNGLLSSRKSVLNGTIVKFMFSYLIEKVISSFGILLL